MVYDKNYFLRLRHFTMANAAPPRTNMLIISGSGSVGEGGVTAAIAELAANDIKTSRANFVLLKKLLSFMLYTSFGRTVNGKYYLNSLAHCNDSACREKLGLKRKWARFDIRIIYYDLP
jgi:hypothetical protein